MSMPFAFLEQLGQGGHYHTHLVLWGIGGGMLLMVLVNLLLRKKASLTTHGGRHGWEQQYLIFQRQQSQR